MSSGFTFGLAKSTTTSGTSGVSFGSPAFSSSTSGFPSASPFGLAATANAASVSAANAPSFSLPASKPTGLFGVGSNSNSTGGSQTGSAFSFGLPAAGSAVRFQGASSGSVSTTATGSSLFNFSASPATVAFAQPTPTVTTSTPSLGSSGFSFGTSAVKPVLSNTTNQPVSLGLPIFPSSIATGLVTQSSTPTSGPISSSLITTSSATNAANSNFLQNVSLSSSTQSPFSSVSLFKQSTSTTTVQGTTSSVASVPGFQMAPLIPPAVQAAKSTVPQLLTSTTAVTSSLMSTLPTTLSISTGGNQVSVGTTKQDPFTSQPGVAAQPTVAPIGLITAAATTTTSSSVVHTTQASTTLQSSKASTFSYLELEELVNKWAHELEEQERYFIDEADRITEWDQTLLNNADKITALYEKVENCKSDQTRLEQELDFIEGQQRELEHLLEPLERAAAELPPGQLHSDFEREAILQLATNVDLELGQLLSDLRDAAGQVNAATSLLEGNRDLSKTGTDDKESEEKLGKAAGENIGAFQQVTKILNCHMHSLNWIHQNTQELLERLKILDGS